MVGYETICKAYSAERRVGEYGPWADGRRWDGGTRRYCTSPGVASVELRWLWSGREAGEATTQHRDWCRRADGDQMSTNCTNSLDSIGSVRKP